ncbi:tetratricopeptide repeat protein [Alteromonas sp. ZYF713]|nr:tetratricopeptide repeat protein [Alteromonas sp. ZYF713]
MKTKSQQAKTFHSWKAIANYFGCSERTVRRWESAEGLPVHRHQHQAAARIFAYQQELDNWFATRSDKPKAPQSSAGHPVRLALFPFIFLGEAQDKAYLADALGEDIVADLTALPALMVISFSSMRQLAAQQADFSDQIKALALDYLIEGSLRFEGESARLNIRLVSTRDQSVVWSNRYIETHPDWQDLQQRIVSHLVTSLPLSNIEAALSPCQRTILSSQTAWEYLHQARIASLTWQSQGIAKALELLNAANQMVPDNALIQASLGRVYLQLRESGIDCSEGPMEKVEDILNVLNQHHSDAFYTLSLQAWFCYLKGDINTAIAALNRALEYQPNDADSLALLANCYLLSGLPSLALPSIQTLQIIDPLTPLSRCMPGYYQLMSGNLREAIAPYQEMLSLDPHNPLARLFMVWVLALNGESTRIESVSAGFDTASTDPLIIQIASALRDNLLGHPVNFSLSAAQGKVVEVNGMLARFTAYGYAACGNKSLAVHWLHRAFELGFRAYPFISQHDPFFRPLKDYPPMQKLLTNMAAEWHSAAEFSSQF